MFWMILFCLILFLLSWLLFAPLYFSLYWNDERQQVQLRWFGIFQLDTFPVGKEWKVQLRVAFFKRQWSLWQLIQPASKSEQTKKQTGRRKKGQGRPGPSLQMMRRVLGSFHITRFRLHLDTGDYVLNAYLFPVFHLLKANQVGDYAINFKGRTDVCVVIENRLARLLRAFFLTK
jgi:hypothetical protein